MTLNNRSNSLFINGEWHVAHGTELTVFNPEKNTPQIVYPDSAWGASKSVVSDARWVLGALPDIKV